MEPMVQFHGVTAIRFGPVQHFHADGHHGEFWTRDLTITGADDYFCIPLFSNTADGLLTEAEKAEEAMVCAMAEQAAQEGGILFAKEEDVPF